METFTETVGMPDDYFVKSVWGAYSNPREALIREVLQNAVDAGAKEVRFTLTDTHFTVEDDGDGMSEDIIRPALLTLNGSYKRVGDVGGFGSAKEIVLFAHRDYEIHTRDVLVRGNGIHYSLAKTEPRQGTRITVRMHERFEYSLPEYLQLARTYLMLCDVKPRVFVNGELQESLVVDRVAATLPWGAIRMKQLRGTTSQYAIVRAKGVVMFRRWVGDLKKQVCVDIECPSTEVLTSNRDSFAYAAQDLVNKEFATLAIDKESYGRKIGAKSVIKGLHSYYLLLKRSPARFAEIVEALRQNECREEVVAEVVRVFQAGPAAAEYFGKTMVHALSSVREAGHDTQADQIAKLLEPTNEAEQVAVDFTIHYGDYAVDGLPQMYHPAHLSVRLRTLIELWRAAVAEVSRLNIEGGERMAFRVGWTFEQLNGKAIPASYTKTDGVHCFLINPQAEEWKGSARGYLPLLVSAAAHEIIHSRGYDYHDERFATELTYLLGKVLGEAEFFRRVRGAAKNLQAELVG